jgi:hypothetical protein
MDKVFTYLPLLFGKDNISRDDKNQMFCVITKKVIHDEFRRFFPDEIIICHYANGLIERSDKLLGSYAIDTLRLIEKGVWNAHSMCYVGDVERKDDFSRNTIFMGCGLQFHPNKTFVTSMEHLGYILGNEWAIVSENILTKYKLFKNVIGKDVALYIIQMVCLLGHYAKN